MTQMTDGNNKRRGAGITQPRIELVKVQDLREYGRNARTHRCKVKRGGCSHG